MNQSNIDAMSALIGTASPIHITNMKATREQMKKDGRRILCGSFADRYTTPDGGL